MKVRPEDNKTYQFSDLQPGDCFIGPTGDVYIKTEPTTVIHQSVTKMINGVRLADAKLCLFHLDLEVNYKPDAEVILG